ncbi:calcium-dependent phosphotriesterase [Amniculicola lignicola CBS 123094]|uniref:Calcium-dependent phosphotriesterase n=1 Tax=Amniculicola lignicola CBS 123094 TaxID=1392246 RepID=A0A6A5X330_9PLEO|nr:calcium-dependent phosphotriesterase [Amniculicola lignicola CBS 123094]
MARRTIYLGLLAIVIPYLYDRYVALSALAANRPSKLKDVYNFRQHEFKFRDSIRNCEDVLLVEEKGLAIVSCDAGRDRWNTVMGTFAQHKGVVGGGLYVYDYATPGLSEQDALARLTLKNIDTEDFHPLGIEYERKSGTLYVVNHAQTGSVIEIFDLDFKTTTATRRQTFRHALAFSPNSIQALGDGKIFFTNDHFIPAAMSPILSKIETFSGVPGGSVVYVDLTRPSETARTLARVPFANGIAMLNSSTLAVASTSKSGIYFFSVTADYHLQSKNHISPPEYHLKSQGYIRTPVAPDNISVDGNGKLLMAGHPFALATMKVSRGRANCDPDSRKEEDRKACDCTAAGWVAEWTPETGLRELYKGYDICTSSTAVRDVGRGIGLVTGLYDRGLMLFKE